MALTEHTWYHCYKYRQCVVMHSVSTVRLLTEKPDYLAMHLCNLAELGFQESTGKVFTLQSTPRVMCPCIQTKSRSRPFVLFTHSMASHCANTLKCINCVLYCVSCLLTYLTINESFIVAWHCNCILVWSILIRFRLPRCVIKGCIPKCLWTQIHGPKTDQSNEMCWPGHKLSQNTKQ